VYIQEFILFVLDFEKWFNFHHNFEKWLELYHFEKIYFLFVFYQHLEVIELIRIVLLQAG
jgi:hypothetical protein